MQLTGHAGRHLSQPLHSAGMMMTSGPWLKMAPNCGGQWRRHASQLMHSAISMRSGGFCHLGLRRCSATRSARATLAVDRDDKGAHRTSRRSTVAAVGGSPARRSFWAWCLESEEPTPAERAELARSLSERSGLSITPQPVPDLADAELRPPR